MIMPTYTKQGSDEGQLAGEKPFKENLTSAHRGYCVVAAVALMAFIPVSLAVGCTGVFYPPISDDLGISAVSLSYFTSIDSVAAIVLMPLVSRMLDKLDARVCLSIASAVLALSFVVRAAMTELWQFYVASVLVGFAIAMMLFMAPPTLINRWFQKRAGVMLGVVMAFTGIGGMVWSSVSGILILQIGWRYTYVLFAILSAMFVAVACALVRTSPASEGFLPVGLAGGGDVCAEDAGNAVAAKGLGSIQFYLICALSFLLNIGLYLYYMIPSYAATLPLSGEIPLIGAWASSFAMAGQTLSKLLLGALGERHPRASMLAVLALGAVGVSLFALAPNSAVSYCAAALGFGFYYGANTVMSPLLTRRAFGDRDYARIYARVSMSGLFANVLSAFIWGAMISSAGNYNSLFVGVFVVLVLAALCSIPLTRR